MYFSILSLGDCITIHRLTKCSFCYYRFLPLENLSSLRKLIVLLSYHEQWFGLGNENEIRTQKEIPEMILRLAITNNVDG